MGGMEGLLGMLPGVGKVKRQLAEANVDVKLLDRQQAIISSMTPRRAAQPEGAEQLAQAAYRRGLGHHRAGREPPASSR